MGFQHLPVIFWVLIYIWNSGFQMGIVAARGN